jgi:hypothetical protein
MSIVVFQVSMACSLMRICRAEVKIEAAYFPESLVQSFKTTRRDSPPEKHLNMLKFVQCEYHEPQFYKRTSVVLHKHTNKHWNDDLRRTCVCMYECMCLCLYIYVCDFVERQG